MLGESNLAGKNHKMTDHSKSLDQDDIDRQWMEYALNLARRAASAGEVPVGAVLVNAQNNIVGEGWNSPISSHDATAHAEIRALRSSSASVKNYRLPDTTLYVTIEPCTMCAGAMVHARIKRLVFGAIEPKAGAVVSQSRVLDQAQNNHRVEYTHGVCEQDASALMSDFFAMRRASKKAKK